MQITEDHWLSEIFGYRVFKVEADASDVLGNIPGRIAEHEKTQPRAMYYSKLDTAAVSVVKELGLANFNVVDVNVTFSIDTKNLAPAGRVKAGRKPAQGKTAFKIVHVGPAEAPAVLDIAGSCFKYSRFHLDPQVPRALAHRIKREWIENYVLKKRGEGLFAAMAGKKAAGFLAVIGSESRRRIVKTIDLIGVAPEFQGRGAGSALVEFFIDRFKNSCDELTVGTQIANVPSMRLYEKHGFSVSKTAYVMHKHVPSPQLLARAGEGKGAALSRSGGRFPLAG